MNRLPRSGHPQRRWRWQCWALAPVLGLGVALPAWPQGLDVVPTLNLTETITIRDGGSGGSNKSDAVTQVSPGISITSRRGPLQGNLSYAANATVHARESSRNAVYHSLASSGKYSILDGRVGFDASASASQQVISAFGTQSADPSISSENQAQTFSYSLSPYLSGRLLGETTYQARLNYTASRSDAGSLGDSASLLSLVSLSGRFSTLGWGLTGSRQVSESGDRPRSHTGQVVGSLSYSPDFDWQMAIRAGWEVDDVRTGQSDGTVTWGASVAWSPGPRTSVNLNYDKRYFGDSHAVTFSHRTARTVWTLSDSRTAQVTGGLTRAEVSNYDLYFSMFASMEPDPVLRDALVRNFLAANGLNPAATVVVGGLLTSTPTVQRQQVAALAYQGLRATLTVLASFSKTKRLSAVNVANDDLSTVDQVRQRGLSVSLSHRLTPQSSMGLTLSQQTTPNAGAVSGNRLRSIAGNWQSRLGQHANLSLGLRYSDFDADTSPYQELAIIGTLGLRF